MTANEIKERTDFLTEFLDLPRTSGRLVKHMSGGQQRRVSLAAALLHQPQLLILDEPTVGVDPLLRQCIWNHLIEISRNANRVCTIVITTHYIEEAQKADIVGMMRFGRLLAEDSPQNLMEMHGKANLESVFLHLCLSDDNESSGLRQVQTSTSKFLEDTKKVESPCSRSRPPRKCMSFHRLRALLVKNFIRMWRNLGFLTFQFIIPTVQVALFCLAIGRQPSDLSFAVVNADASAIDKCHFYTNGCILGNKDDFMGGYDGYTGHKKNLSCRFLSYVDAEFLIPVFYDNLTEAKEAAQRGKHWGVMQFKSDYTEALYDRMFGLAELRSPDNHTLEKSDVQVHLDMTNQQVSKFILDKQKGG